MSLRTSLSIIGIGAAAAVGLLLAVVSRSGASGGGMDAMSIDLDPSGNTATSLGPLDSCREVQPGDTVTLDVTATNIPASNPMVAFSYAIRYDDVNLPIQSQDHNFLLAAIPGSSVFNPSQPTPDTDGNGEWIASADDLASPAASYAESGSGVLSRLSLAIGAGEPNGLYTLGLAYAGHIDPYNEAFPPDVLNAGMVAVGVACPVSGTPTPTAGPPSPTPTPSPTPVPPT